MTSIFKAPSVPAPPPPPDPPAKVDMEKAAALSEEAVRDVRKRRGRRSTIVGGLIGDTNDAESAKPTLMS